MDAALTIDTARRIARGLERRERDRAGGSIGKARERLAGKLGQPWTPGTLYNLARDRLKKLDGDLREALAAYAIEDLEADIERLRHDLATARALGAAQNPALVRQIAAVLDRAQFLYSEIAGDHSP